jgi:hypothetical protein
MDKDTALAILENLAEKQGNETVPTEDVIDIAQAVLALYRHLAKEDK